MIILFFDGNIQEAPGAELKHLEFLAEENTDPRKSLAGRLCEDIPQNVCVLAYSMGFEKGRIKELAEFFKKSLPQVSEHLMNIYDNIKDLIQPFQSHAYYSVELGRSYSIKKVLPALCPNESCIHYVIQTKPGRKSAHEESPSCLLPIGYPGNGEDS
jgi:glucose-6-phosphate-specific signal transduction histidine kinase